MYGLVNRAIEQLVVSIKGPDAWAHVCQMAQWPDEGFVALQVYDDAVTYRLVGAVSQELNMPPDQVLRAFGEYWILYTAEQGYGAMLASCGSNLRDFLYGMNHMHARIETTMRDVRTPNFDIKDLSDDDLELTYESEREGLAPMVEGLLTGLAKRFGQTIDVQHVAARAPGVPRDVFHIHIHH
jgi:Haem-NO-binding